VRDLLYLGSSTPFLSERGPPETPGLQFLWFVTASNVRDCTNHANTQQPCVRTAMPGIYPSPAPKSFTYAPNVRTLDT